MRTTKGDLDHAGVVFVEEAEGLGARLLGVESCYPSESTERDLTRVTERSPDPADVPDEIQLF
jgi:hypothetical protein